MRRYYGLVSVNTTLAEVEKVAFVEETLSVDGFHFYQLMEVRIPQICVPPRPLDLHNFLLLQRPRNPQHLAQLLSQIFPILLNLHNSLKLIQIAVSLPLPAVAHLQQSHYLDIYVILTELLHVQLTVIVLVYQLQLVYDFYGLGEVLRSQGLQVGNVGFGDFGMVEI